MQAKYAHLKSKNLVDMSLLQLGRFKEQISPPFYVGNMVKGVIDTVKSLAQKK